MIFLTETVFQETHDLEQLQNMVTSTPVAVMGCLSLVTYTYRRIQIGTMKALDVYRVDDRFLH